MWKIETKQKKKEEGGRNGDCIAKKYSKNK